MTTLRLGERKLIIITIEEDSAVSKLRQPFAILIPADQPSLGSSEKRLIKAAATKRCREYCCVGPYSEQLHDYIDGVLEDRGLIDVLTTWHTDESPDEALEYFVHVAGGAPSSLVAAIKGRSVLSDKLKRIAGRPRPGQRGGPLQRPRHG